MRIGIDARFYGPFGKGLGRYTQKLVTHLERIDHANEYVVFLRRENWADYQPKNPRFTKALADYQWYSLAEQLLMPLTLWTHKLDLVHFTHFNVPILYFGKFIVTIHDLILTKYPTERATRLGPLAYRVKHAGYELAIRSAIQRAERVISVSEFTKQEIVDHFHTTPSKISVTYEAVDPPAETGGDRAQVLRHYRVQPPYILYVGNVYPHKNIEGLLTAFTTVMRRYPDLRLVLVGKEDYFFKRIKQEVRSRGLEQRVVFTGFVTDQDLPYLYAQARLFAFPSFCEGFGLPALEACSYGVPVVASNDSSLPEVLGDAARYFDPHQPDEIAQAILDVLDHGTLSAQLVARGHERVKRFSWQQMAEATRKLYKEVY